MPKIEGEALDRTLWELALDNATDLAYNRLQTEYTYIHTCIHIHTHIHMYRTYAGYFPCFYFQAFCAKYKKTMQRPLSSVLRHRVHLMSDGDLVPVTKTFDGF